MVAVEAFEDRFSQWIDLGENHPNDGRRLRQPAFANAGQLDWKQRKKSERFELTC